MSSPTGKKYHAIVVAVITGAVVLACMQAVSSENDTATVPTLQPSLSVHVTTLESQTLMNTVTANGDIAAWQEVSIGTEISGLRLVDVMVDVGDMVSEGQVLAIYNADTVRAELARSRADVAEAEATLAEATADAQRARSLKASGALSDQRIQQYETAELTARSRLGVAQAQDNVQELRLGQTQVIAMDDGLITSRTATVGAITGTDQELFRLTRHARLEWRAEVAASDLNKLRTGQTARVILSEGFELEGRVRTIAPLVDPFTRNGLVYIDLPLNDIARAGMFARGEVELGTRQGLMLPRSAVQVRDGFGYVHRVSSDGQITELKVSLGQHTDDRIEILSGMEIDDRVVASGGAFLGNGDQVRIIEEAQSNISPINGRNVEDSL